MTAFNAEIKRLLAVADAATSTDAKGRAYEVVLEYVFKSIKGTMVRPNRLSYYKTEQVDLAVGHDGAALNLPRHFLVECKNYGDSLDSKSVGYFLFIAMSRGIKLAVVAAASGLTGDPDELTYAHSLAAKVSAQCKLILLTRTDLEALTSPQKLVDLMNDLYLQAFSDGNIGYRRSS